MKLPPNASPALAQRTAPARRPFSLPAPIRVAGLKAPTSAARAITGVPRIQKPAPVTTPRAGQEPAHHLPLPNARAHVQPSEPMMGASPAGPRPAHVAGPTEVLQRVQAWVEAGTPRLALQVGGALAGRVELVRTGPGRVKLAWRCRHGSAAGLASRVRAALFAAGLQVDDVRVDVAP